MYKLQLETKFITYEVLKFVSPQVWEMFKHVGFWPELQQP